MAVVSLEVEITSSLSASKQFKIYSDFDNIAPKVDPQTYKSITLIQGDGGVGSLRSMKFSDGSTWKHMVNVVDTNNLSASYTIFEGDSSIGAIDTVTHHVKFIPSADGGSVYKHTISIKCHGDAKLTDEVTNLFKEATTNTFKAIDSYAIDHPEAY